MNLNQVTLEARIADPSGNEICLFWAGENRKNPPWRIPALALVSALTWAGAFST